MIEDPESSDWPWRQVARLLQDNLGKEWARQVMMDWLKRFPSTSTTNILKSKKAPFHCHYILVCTTPYVYVPHPHVYKMVQYVAVISSPPPRHRHLYNLVPYPVLIIHLQLQHHL